MQDQNPTPQPKPAAHWRELAAQAANESDPRKLSDLVRQLCDQLDEIQKQRKPAQSQAEPDPSLPAAK